MGSYGTVIGSNEVAKESDGAAMTSYVGSRRISWDRNVIVFGALLGPMGPLWDLMGPQCDRTGTGRDSRRILQHRLGSRQALCDRNGIVRGSGGWLSSDLCTQSNERCEPER